MSSIEQLQADMFRLSKHVSGENYNTGPTERAIANKAILQAKILGLCEGLDIPESDEAVDIGVFTVLPTKALTNWSSDTGNCSVLAGDVYLDFHIPKANDLSVAVASEGYSQIAKYMQKHEDISQIMGVTYRVMSMSAERNHGFHSEKILLPETVGKFATAYWQYIMPDIKASQFQSAYVVWQTREEFIDRFGS